MIKLSAGTGSDEVYLRNAEFGDTWTIDTNTVVAQTLNGTSKAYKGARPTFQKSRLTSRINKQDEMEALVLFLADYAGKQITIDVDDKGSFWKTIEGYIINPISDIVTEKSDCSYTVTLEILHVITSPDYLFPTVCPGD